VHHTHPAAAQLLDDAIVRDGLADELGGGSHARGGHVRGGESLEVFRAQSQTGHQAHPAAAQLLDDTVVRNGLADHAWCSAILVGTGWHVNGIGGSCQLGPLPVG